MVSSTLYGIVFLIAVTYFMLMRKLAFGWKSIPYFRSSGATDTLSVTVLIPFKNESRHLSQLVDSLKNQRYPNCEFLFIDDHSEDRGAERIRELIKETERFRLISNSGNGKKEAIKSGIYNSSGKLIITLDADATPSPMWVETIVGFYRSTKPDLIIAPVAIPSGKGLLHNFQQLEFFSLVASGAGAAGAGFPILCNGANLAFTRTAWLQSENELHFETPSGDDVLLLQSIKRRGGKISFLKSLHALVTTEPKHSVQEFVHQRSRWASKGAMYNDRDLVAVALIVFVTAFLLALLFIASFISIQFIPPFILLFLTKYVADLMLLSHAAPLFKVEKTAGKLALFSLFYPFYVLLSAGSALFHRKNNW